MILQKREEILTQMLQKRETRDQSMKDMYGDTMQKYVVLNKFSNCNGVVIIVYLLCMMNNSCFHFCFPGFISTLIIKSGSEKGNCPI